MCGNVSLHSGLLGVCVGAVVKHFPRRYCSGSEGRQMHGAHDVALPRSPKQVIPTQTTQHTPPTQPTIQPTNSTNNTHTQPSDNHALVTGLLPCLHCLSRVQLHRVLVRSAVLTMVEMVGCVGLFECVLVGVGVG